MGGGFEVNLIGKLSTRTRAVEHRLGRLLRVHDHAGYHGGFVRVVR